MEGTVSAGELTYPTPLLGDPKLLGWLLVLVEETPGDEGDGLPCPLSKVQPRKVVSCPLDDDMVQGSPLSRISKVGAQYETGRFSRRADVPITHFSATLKEKSLREAISETIEETSGEGAAG